MALPIHVDTYSGYKANERPREFTLDEQIYEIAAVLDHWYEQSATYFKVQSTEGKTYLLRYDEEVDEWTFLTATNC
jgi:predicted RNA-binding protein